MDDNSIKVLFPTTCPHCQKPLLAEIMATAPVVKSLLTDDDIKKAKDEMVARVNLLAIPQSQKDEAIAWAQQEETIFTSGDIDAILKNIVNDNSQKPTTI